ncbi:sugar phosphate isomerase/epimerase family protein [Streptomyces acidiscabies]|uniref:Sugar phosphate isomerase/epimerase n=1 Tax=Streptomyces acidiscabies TaxID=42234 RepID=A0AAP6BLP7_9ACTN|nr:sugar phosphate isomerase/epimerase [Streptomyces acidiscabies]MBP5942218.1 sugar phosphate isomerase/epimerase [Streptomyces sp. LBUM 1476]MBZ3913738.1 sugar phosphate isomerase/epimerase [Streptomyces acidiscabies]MDX2966925.1 sugar phosphate isomerase/epimerase [Streptomyces acidiscabies]MDX3022171.1 sugar phosphate isomerase/epimerase [Streptomyces acidiscabies]MDX3795434.1 sugar phosphate isomerase/epimerase [Streptomyces acidiscabies]
MSNRDISLQLYTLRSLLEEDPEGTLARVAEIGYTTVEPYGFVHRAERISDALTAHGLSAPTAHVPLLSDDRPTVYAAARRLGVSTLVVPMAAPERWQTRESIESLAADLNRVAAEAADHGFTVGYHNHHFELELRQNGTHALEILAESLADEVVLEVDTYWAAVGGADVPALLGRLGDRVAALHVKDGDRTLNTKAQVAVGDGVLPVEEILAAAPDALRVVELDDFDGDILDPVAKSLGFLSGLKDG